MARKEYRDNFRVVLAVDQDEMMDYGDAATRDERLRRRAQSRAEELCAQVKRHVDDGRHARVESDAIRVCEHCGSRWTEKSTTYNGGCCAKDEAANPNPETVDEIKTAASG